jgi:protein SCO1/2
MKPSVLIAIGIAVTLLVGGLIALLSLRQHAASIALPPPSPYRGSIPPPGIRAPDFTLRDYRGTQVTMRKLRGKVVVLTFVDSKCTQKCPIVTSVIAQTIKQLPMSTRRRVAPVLMSVDPKVDTASSVRRFLSRRGALSLTYVIGPTREMRPIWKAYGILAAADSDNADVHSSDVRIFDRHGIWVASQHAGEDLTTANLKHDISLALRR